MQMFFFSLNEMELECLSYILVYLHVFAASSSNTFTKTFTGIDGAGKRLADEVSLIQSDMYF